MSFISLFFVWFFPITAFIYFILPQKYRNVWLLVASYFAYYRWNGAFVLLLIYSTSISYISGYLLDKYRKKWILVCSLIVNLIPLFWYKYFFLLVSTANMVITKIGLSPIKDNYDIVLPVGISFFTFQAISYVVDVYRDDTKQEKSIIKYALYISFFPQLVAGPIEKSKEFLKQFDEKHDFNEHEVLVGILQILYGFFLKLAIADRVAVIADEIFGNVDKYTGIYMVVGAMAFMLQIFCDFAGYTTIALGAARGLGFRLTDNFQTPFLSKSVAEFWRRWHISLSTWFKEYLYFPLGGSRKGKVRKYINLIVVFAVSGMWHGASWGFLIWGLLNGLYQVVGEMLGRTRNSVRNFLKFNVNTLGYKLACVIVTDALVTFSFIFFRARDISNGFLYIKKMVAGFNPWILLDGSLYQLGLDDKDMQVLFFCIVILIIAELLKYKKYKVSEIFLKQDIWVRVPMYLVIVFFLIIFSYYGASDSARFIYFAF